MDTKTSFSVSPPPQSRSQAVVCASTPRMYPRSGYFLVTHKGSKTSYKPVLYINYCLQLLNQIAKCSKGRTVCIHCHSFYTILEIV